MAVSLSPIELVILGISYSVPDRVYRVPSCRRKYAQALADRDSPLAEYDPQRRELKITNAGVEALWAVRKETA